MGTCERHGLAMGPEGRCVVCRRELRDKLAGLPPDERRLRTGIRWGIALLAGIATFALLLALLDTRKRAQDGAPARPGDPVTPVVP